MLSTACYRDVRCTSLYSGKLLRVGKNEQFVGKTCAECSVGAAYPTVTGGSQAVQSVKIFSLETFPFFGTWRIKT